MLIRILFGAFLFAFWVARFILSVTVWPLCRLIGKKRIVRLASKILNDPRVEQAICSSGGAAGMMQLRSMLAQMRIAEDGDEPADEPEVVSEPEAPIHAAWPEDLPMPPEASTIREVSVGMKLAGPEFEDWRFATSEAFRTSGAMLMITEGCAEWARMAKKRGMPTDVVKTSFTGGALLSAFQLGLIVGEYTYEQDHPEADSQRVVDGFQKIYATNPDARDNPLCGGPAS